MKNNDKVLVAFLVAAGFFSALQAKQYVQSLTAKDKKIIVSISKSSPNIQLVSGSADQFAIGDDKNKTQTV
ncbi:MAG: hypothetical protein ACYC4Q_04725 [Victivallaceae bacterium]